jgi:hypothetical protein
MRRVWALATFFLTLSVACLLARPAAAQVKEVRRVLILNEVGSSYSGINQIDRGISTALDSSRYQLEFYREYMETALFPDPADQQQFRASFLAKYRNRKPDVIITVGPSPLRLMAETHETFFSGVPVVFVNPLRTITFFAARMCRIKLDLLPTNVPPGGQSIDRAAADVLRRPACVPPNDTR